MAQVPARGLADGGAGLALLLGQLDQPLRHARVLAAGLELGGGWLTCTLCSPHPKERRSSFLLNRSHLVAPRPRPVSNQPPTVCQPWAASCPDHTERPSSYWAGACHCKLTAVLLWARPASACRSCSRTGDASAGPSCIQEKQSVPLNRNPFMLNVAVRRRRVNGRGKLEDEGERLCEGLWREMRGGACVPDSAQAELRHVGLADVGGLARRVVEGDGDAILPIGVLGEAVRRSVLQLPMPIVTAESREYTPIGDFWTRAGDRVMPPLPGVASCAFPSGRRCHLHVLLPRRRPRNQHGVRRTPSSLVTLCLRLARRLLALLPCPG
jgi:hypothetical protein